MRWQVPRFAQLCPQILRHFRARHFERTRRRFRRGVPAGGVYVKRIILCYIDGWAQSEAHPSLQFIGVREVAAEIAVFQHGGELSKPLLLHDRSCDDGGKPFTCEFKTISEEGTHERCFGAPK